MYFFGLGRQIGVALVKLITSHVGLGRITSIGQQEPSS